MVIRFNKKIALIATATLLVVVIFIAAVLMGARDDDEGPPTTPDIIEISDLPYDEGFRVIRTTQENTEGDAFQRVANIFDGYQLRVPEEWNVPETATREGGLKIFFSFDTRIIPLEVREGGFFEVRTIKNTENKNVRDWLSGGGIESYFPSHAFGEFIIASGENPDERIYMLSEQFFERDPNLNKIFIENSQRLSYIVGGDQKIYLISCIAIGDDFEALITQCRDVALSFNIL